MSMQLNPAFSRGLLNTCAPIGASNVELSVKRGRIAGDRVEPLD